MITTTITAEEFLEGNHWVCLITRKENGVKIEEHKIVCKAEVFKKPSKGD